MSSDRHIYGSINRPPASPSCPPTPVTYPEHTVATPRVEVSHSEFTKSWSTPQTEGFQTPAKTLSFSRPLSQPGYKPRTPEHLDFHVNRFAPSNLPLPPVEPSRRLSSSPVAATQSKDRPRRDMNLQGPRASMENPQIAQMQTPPPTRDAFSRGSFQQNTGNEANTPETVIGRTPAQGTGGHGMYSQMSFGFPSLQFSPGTVPLPGDSPMSAPVLSESNNFWGHQPDDSAMNGGFTGMATFDSTSYQEGPAANWQSFDAPNRGINQQAFEALHGLPPSGQDASLSSNSQRSIKPLSNRRPASFISTSASVDPSMLFSFSAPGAAESFGTAPPLGNPNNEERRPYSVQPGNTQREMGLANPAKGQHSRTSTTSSVGSSQESRPGLQRSNTDSGFRKARPVSMGSRSYAPAVAPNIPRRSSPLKRQSGGSLKAIPELGRPRTRLVVDENGHARTETIIPGQEQRRPVSRGATRNDLRHQYPGLWNGDDSDSEPDEPALSRNTSFVAPHRRQSKHARTDSDGLDAPGAFKVTRPASGVFDRSSLDVFHSGAKNTTDSSFRRFSMMDFPSSFTGPSGPGDRETPNSPGDALGALRKVVEGRQKRSELHFQGSQKAHAPRLQPTANLTNAYQGRGHPESYSNICEPSPTHSADAGLVTPRTDRSSSTDGTRCICNGPDNGQAMVQCESCNKWLHMRCVGLNSENLPPVYVCVFCTGQTPIARGGRIRGPMPQLDSPLTHKSVVRR